MRKGQGLTRPTGALSWAGRTPRAAFLHFPALKTLWPPGQGQLWELLEQALAGGRVQEVPRAAINQRVESSRGKFKASDVGS